MNLKTEFKDFLKQKVARTYEQYVDSLGDNLKKDCLSSSIQYFASFIQKGNGDGLYGIGNPYIIGDFISQLDRNRSNSTFKGTPLYNRFFLHNPPARPALKWYLSFLIAKLASKNLNQLNKIEGALKNKSLAHAYNNLGKYMDTLGITHDANYEGGGEISDYPIDTNNDEVSDPPANDPNINQTSAPRIPLQIIVYGAPGTGKSNVLKEWLELKNVPDENIFRTTFHPDYDYSTFVGLYKPQMDRGNIVYKFQPHVFLDAYIKAWGNLDRFRLQNDYIISSDSDKKDVFIIIEELNRGNCAQIFGDIFQLLDRDTEGFSVYPITSDADVADYIQGQGIKSNDRPKINDGKTLILPPNLHIWATMNTSDQSLFPIDSAFTRRWQKIFVPINEDDAIATNIFGYSWKVILKAINKIIGNYAPEKKIGPWFFQPSEGENAFVGKVIHYLYHDVLTIYDPNNPLYKEIPFDSFIKSITIDAYNLFGNNVDENIVKKWIHMLFKMAGIGDVHTFIEEDATTEETDEDYNEAALNETDVEDDNQSADEP